MRDLMNTSIRTLTIQKLAKIIRTSLIRPILIQDPVHDMSNIYERFMMIHLYLMPCGKLLI